jgi:hypothetical protein
MGHTRLGKLPKTQNWDAVVASLFGEADPAKTDFGFEIARVAFATLDAAQRALEGVKPDEALGDIFFLLTRLALSGRKVGWLTYLRENGIDLPDDCGPLDLRIAFGDAIDRRLREAGLASDVAEMAHLAAGEALTAFMESEPGDLFSGNKDQLQAVLRRMAGKKGFGRLARNFFGGFVARFLNFYLSRTVRTDLGASGLDQVGDVTRFNESLRLHCQQSARIVEIFAAEWLSKTEYQQGVDRRNASAFVAIALRKLRDEMADQAGLNA